MIKGKVSLYAIMCIITYAIFNITTASAQQNFVDVRPVKHITETFAKALADKNIEVWKTYQCGSNYAKSWTAGTYMRLTGKGFVWTDGAGVVHFHLFTMNPPMSLEGFRPPMTLNTSPYDADGNIVVGDPGYWIRYRIWQGRPCIDWVDAMRSNRNLAAAWNYMLTHINNSQAYSKQWQAFGLESDGSMPLLNAPQQYIEPITDAQVQWAYQGSDVMPIQPYTSQPGAGGVDVIYIGVAGVLFLGVVVVVAVKSRIKEYA